MYEQIEHPQVHRENTDIRFGPIVGVIATVAISLTLASLGAAWFLGHENRVHAPAATARGISPSASLPAEPRLEPLALSTPDSGPLFRAQQQAQEAALHTFSKTDDPGFVRVPIETAIEQLAKDLNSGTPSEKRDAKSHGLVGGGEGNSGRLLRKASP